MHVIHAWDLEKGVWSMRESRLARWSAWPHVQGPWVYASSSLLLLIKPLSFSLLLLIMPWQGSCHAACPCMVPPQLGHHSN